MGTTFDEYMETSEKANSPDAKGLREAFRSRCQLAVQLINLREKRGLSQSELARRTGVNQAEISRIERGSGNPTERTLLKLANALGADLRLVERNDVATD
jgi:ribosome-binding protein aMBF1 (putative translation factor)